MMLRIGIYAFGGCEGCRYRLIESILNLDGIEIVYEPLLGLNKEADEYDLVFIEGAVISEEDLKKLKEIRKKTKVLVALGSCAALGGIPGLRSFSKEEGIESVYEGKEIMVSVLEEPPSALSKYVEVDYEIRGCPPTPEELVRLINNLKDSLWFKVAERRFEFCRDVVYDVEGEAIKLIGEKCIVCGRCVKICRDMEISAINYVNRGISIAVTTPYRIRIDESACINCGQCTLYCPVGAMIEKDFTSEIRKLLRERELDILIEPEALESLKHATGSYEDKIASAFKSLGFKRVSLWKPQFLAKDRDGLLIIPYSEAETAFIEKFYKDLMGYTIPPPKIPTLEDGKVLVSQCIARKVGRNNVITTREAFRMIRNFDFETIPDSSMEVETPINVRPEGDFIDIVGPNEVREVLDKIRKGSIKDGKFRLFICPGGCKMGGGQVYPESNDLSF
ncbi:MAG: 4Fe-4S binding protein [Candidatus Odinarchaeota archaeon]|nr:4Fe-4S binding protein [Candidatus Odinarchaeota archaeon]